MGDEATADAERPEPRWWEVAEETAEPPVESRCPACGWPDAKAAKAPLKAGARPPAAAEEADKEALEKAV